MWTVDLTGLVTCVPPDARVVVPDWVATAIQDQAAAGVAGAEVLLSRLAPLADRPATRPARPTETAGGHDLGASRAGRGA